MEFYFSLFPIFIRFQFIPSLPIGLVGGGLPYGPFGQNILLPHIWHFLVNFGDIFGFFVLEGYSNLRVFHGNYGNLHEQFTITNLYLRSLTL